MNEKLRIEGRKKLTGEVSIAGAKNAVLKLMAAVLLVPDESCIHNVPDLSDVRIMLNLLEELGVKTQYDKKEKKVIINAKSITNVVAHYNWVSKMRASFILLGALVGRCKEAIVALPGGCAIGKRRVDFHIKGLEALGASIKIENGYVVAKASHLKGADIYLDIPSVGATENLMLAAVLADGATKIQNAAQEPEIVDLANFLNGMGADVQGAGTSEIIINGVKQSDLKPIEYTTMPDRIEAGTYMAAVVATQGKAIIRNVFPNHLTFFTDKLLKMGAEIKIIEPCAIEVSSKFPLEAVNVITQPYPGFPTDLQAIIMVLMSVSNGVSIITESLYENRFMHVPELRKMGADIQQDGNLAIVKGVKSLSCANLKATDLRAGASLVVAGLMAEGITEIENIYHIDRGYENLEFKLQSLGANITRVKSSPSPLKKTSVEEFREKRDESKL